MHYIFLSVAGSAGVYHSVYICMARMAIISTMELIF